MKILVIGGGGFIGSHLVNDMVAAGHVVTALGRRPVPFRPLPPNVGYVSGSLDDRNLMRRLVADSDAVAHLASATVPTTGDKNPVEDVQANLIGTLNLLDAMAETGCDRLLYISSGGTVYGVPQSTPITELHPLAPVCSYGIVKVAIETYLNLYARTSGLRPITIRASNPYGPFQGNLGIQGIIGTYLNRALNHQPIEIWGDGSTIRDFIFVPDLTRLCLTALESNKVGIYNGGTGHGTSIQEIAELVQEATGQKIPVLYRPGRKLDVPISVLDTTKAQTDFGWTPSVSLREGISLTWANLEHENHIFSTAQS